MFLTKTDTKAVQKDSDFQINQVLNVEKVREDLLARDFPSIWLEHKEHFNKSTLIAGFYCEWSHNGLRTEEGQRDRKNKF